MRKITPDDALAYHRLGGKPGKLAIVPTKPMATQHDLSLAYTPGVAVPVLEIAHDPDLAYEYTAKGNLVAVVSNGTAVLGLGDIGALAGKPVMEGKGVLFKKFADVDVFDIEVNSHDPDGRDPDVCQALAPTFGGINLEDIKAPECFDIEETLKATLNIPVFHDDQHGTAIISGAALINALELVGKHIEDVRVVFSARAPRALPARGCGRLGVRREHPAGGHQGVFYRGRDRIHEQVQGALRAEDRSADAGRRAWRGATCSAACRAAEVLKEMVRSMAKDRSSLPWRIRIRKSPTPAQDARTDVIMATGRRDYPNQVNNVLGFPFIFRGALDVQASQINETMKMAAAHALALSRRKTCRTTCARPTRWTGFSSGANT